MIDVQQALQNIEAKYGVRILYACEAGSRAWGYATEDSDCDVRFIYVHSRAWYLSLFSQRDVIEGTRDEIEFVGWDLSKALKLLTKSNPTLLEWLQSPRVLHEVPEFIHVRNLADEAFSLKPMVFHYIKMGKKNLLSYRKTKKQKFLLYALKSFLLSDHVYRKGKMNVNDLRIFLKNSHLPEDMKVSCMALLSRKFLNKTEHVTAFIENQLDDLEEKATNYKSNQAVERGKFDSVFLQLLDDK